MLVDVSVSSSWVADGLVVVTVIVLPGEVTVTVRVVVAGASELQALIKDNEPTVAPPAISPAFFKKSLREIECFSSLSIDSLLSFLK
jgi:hypothetical protein